MPTCLKLAVTTEFDDCAAGCVRLDPPTGLPVQQGRKRGCVRYSPVVFSILPYSVVIECCNKNGLLCIKNTQNLILNCFRMLCSELNRYFRTVKSLESEHFSELKQYFQVFSQRSWVLKILTCALFKAFFVRLCVHSDSLKIKRKSEYQDSQNMSKFQFQSFKFRINNTSDSYQLRFRLF